MKKSPFRNLPLALCLLISFTSYSQEKDSWLKKLFNKEEQEGVKAEPSDSLDILLDEYLKEKQDEQMVPQKDSTPDHRMPLKEGDVRIYQDQKLKSLNDSLVEHPAPLYGYRIQIYFGNLEQAREVRAKYIRSHTGENCVIEHIAPNFSVQAGDYHDQYAAYRRLRELKKEFPGAIVIPGTIDLAPLPE